MCKLSKKKIPQLEQHQDSSCQLIRSLEGEGGLPDPAEDAHLKNCMKTSMMKSVGMSGSAIYCCVGGPKRLREESYSSRKVQKTRKRSQHKEEKPYGRTIEQRIQRGWIDLQKELFLDIIVIITLFMLFFNPESVSFSPAIPSSH